jgi:hypothetical protein
MGNIPPPLRNIAFLLLGIYTFRMANKEVKQLGTGIATATPDKPFDDYLRITYAPSEEGARIMRPIGFALFSIDQRAAEAALKVGRLGVSEIGDVWRKNEDGKIVKVTDRLDIHHALETVRENGEEFSLNEYEDKNTGKRILIETHPGDQNLQLWFVKNSQDQQRLVDAVYCRHFHQPAKGDDGNILSEEQTLAEALRVGITFYITPNGTPLLNKIPRK